MSFVPNEQQAKAIHARGNILVSAAAGSGKTAVLVERVIERILDPADPVDADRLLVVTFTNAAATEMKQRISAGIGERLRQNPGDPALLRQRALLASAPICTMDSYCLQLVREQFHKLDISPDFKIADTSLLQVLQMQAMDQILDEAFAGGSPEFFRLLEYLGADNADYTLKNAIEKIYFYLRSLPFPADWTEKVLSLYRQEDAGSSAWTDILLQKAKEELLHLQEALSAAETALTEPETFSLRNSVQVVGEQVALLYAAAEGGYEALRTALSQISLNLPRKNNKLTEFSGAAAAFSAFEDLKSVLGELNALFGTPFEALARDLRDIAPAVEVLFDLVEQYWQRLDALKAARRILDFADIEYLALRLLVQKTQQGLEYTRVARELSEHFREVLVDEYQDTNDLQDTILTALSAGGERLFLVGDVKQSIYRFRKANPDNFLRRYRQFPDYSGPEQKQGKILLSANYRSRAGICDFVNFTFRLLMSEKVGDIAYTKREELISGAVYPPRQGPDVSLHLLDLGNCEERDIVMEARLIADRILALCKDPEAVADEANPGGMRCARFSDFAILLRSPGPRQNIMAAELAKKGIPVWMNADGGFLSSVEISTVLSFLRIIDNPLLEVPLLAALHSPLFGFSPDRLAEMRALHPKLNLYRAVLSEAEKGREDCREFLSQLEHFRRLSATLPADTLIQRIYDETGYYILVQAMENGAQRRANLLLLLEYARNFESTGFRGLGSFLRFIDRLDPDAAGLNSAGVATEEDNVVRLMSIHRSKGLQFPICILAGCSGRFNNKDYTASMVLHEDFGIGLKIVDESTRTRRSTLPREAVAIETRRAGISEEMRLLYVAMTRAKERLLIFVSKDLEKTLSNLTSQLIAGYSGADETIEPRLLLKSGSLSDWILMAALLHPDGGRLRELAEQSPNPAIAEGRMQVDVTNWADLREGETEAQEPEESCEADPERVAELERRLSYQYPYAVLEGVAAKRAASRLTAEEADNAFQFTARPAFLSGAGATPAERGIAIHTFMEYADYALAGQDLEEEIGRLVSGGFISRRQADLIDRKKLAPFFESALYARMQAAPRLWREHRFITSLPLRQLEPGADPLVSEEEIVIQGSADCVFVENGRLVIVDYKTDRSRDAAALAAHYAPQLRLYAAVAEKTLGMPVGELLLYSFELQREVPVPLRDADMTGFAG